MYMTIFNYFKGRTTIIIAHRLSKIKKSYLKI